MRAFIRQGEDLQAQFLPSEAALLTSLVAQLTELLDPLAQAGEAPDDPDAMLNSLTHSTAGPPIQDPALRRLFPDAYRDDEQASVDFRRYTQSDQAQAKMRAARTVVTDIAAADDDLVSLPSGHVDDWLTTLTNLRLVLAVRLGIEHESDTEDLSRLPDEDPRRPVVALLNWCGWIQETILADL